MKWYFSLMVSFFLVNSYGQEYPEMVVEGATWVYSENDDGIKSYFAYHITGDTIINGENYSILNQHAVNKGSTGFLEISQNGLPSAYMREDTTAKKVYAIIKESSLINDDLNAFNESFGPGEYDDEYLLYDFSLEVGDTLNAPIDFVVWNIETVEILGYEVNIIEIETGNPYYEKLGGFSGLFYPHHYFFTAGYGTSLVGYCITADFDCGIFVGVDAVADLEENDFSIYPNPATNSITINLVHENIQSLRLYSSNGAQVFVQDGIDSDEATIDLTTLHYSGILTAVGFTKNSRFIGRFIVMGD